jgi:hypothetical protein
MNMELKQAPIDTNIPDKPSSPILSIPVVRYIGPKFRVRLSYPDEKEVTLATADGKS